MSTERDFWDVVYLDGDYDKDDHSGKWHKDPKYVGNPPHVFIRAESINKPSDDMSVPMKNPYKEYLMYEEGVGWVIGYYDSGWKQFICNDVSSGGEMFFTPPSHWLPLPDDPE